MIVGEAHFADDELSPGEMKQRATSGALVYALRGIALRILGLGVQLLFARMLGPDAFGQIGVGLTVIALATAAADVGLGVGLIRRKEPPTSVELQTLVGLSLCGSVVIVGLVVALASALTESAWPTALMICALPTLAFRLPAFVRFERSLRFKSIAAVEVIETLVASTWALGGAALGWGVWALASSYAVRMVVGTVCINAIARQRPMRPRFRIAPVRPLIAFGLQLQLVNILNYSRDFALWGLTLGLSTSVAWGLYTLVNQVIKAPLLLVDSLWRVSMPTMSRLMHEGVDVAGTLRRANGIAALILGVVAVPLAVAAPVVLVPLFGAEYRGAGDVLAWSAVALFISAPPAVACMGYLLAAGLGRWVVLATLSEIATNFVVAASLLPSMGAMALAIGWLAAAVVHALALLALAARHLGAGGSRPARASFAELVPDLFACLGAGIAVSVVGIVAWRVLPDGAGVWNSAAAGLAAGLGAAVAALVVFVGVVGLCRRSLLVATLDLFRSVVPRFARRA